VCRKCREEKPAAEFFSGKQNRDGLQSYCKACVYRCNRDWATANRDRVRAKYRKHDLKRTFGITVEQYDEMLRRQKGVCAICQKPCKSGRRLAVDHDHATGRVRALLCSNCNRGIGCFHDDPQMLEAAIRYLSG